MLADDIEELRAAVQNVAARRGLTLAEQLAFALQLVAELQAQVDDLRAQVTARDALRRQLVGEGCRG